MKNKKIIKYKMSLVKTEDFRICKKLGQDIEKLKNLKLSNPSGDITIFIEYDKQWNNTTVCVFADMFFENQEHIIENVLNRKKEIQFSDIILSQCGFRPLPEKLEINFGAVFERKRFVITFVFKRKVYEFYRL
jgi:hypothetical protein